MTRLQGVKGGLRLGMLDGVTVFAHDLFQVDPDDLPGLEIALTVVDGRPVHRSPTLP